jgi:2-polyprenyl-3-methyl-5-hydroxy-6-metoxy-1,4-benzoquinol methylase
MTHIQVNQDSRFEFGANWRRFLETVDESRIDAAVISLRQMLGVESLVERRFLDVGSGSGLFSLAAQRLGAGVHSFDYDPQSVACTREMKRRFAPDADDWTIDQGSALDAEYLAGLSPADVVYSWGVLHHTGDMWTAIDLVSQRVNPGGRFWLAIYNDQGRTTSDWIRIKRCYQALPTFLRPLLVTIIGGCLLTHRLMRAAGSSLVHLLTLGNPLTPFRSLAEKAQSPDPRGMSRWYDLVDWVGGWPFEVARPEQVIGFLAERDFALQSLRTVGGRMGCNEFVFLRRGSGD